MSTFNKVITKLLTEYKSIVKKFLSPKVATAKIDALGLKRKELRYDDDVALFYKSQRVLEDMQVWLRSEVRSHWYSGLDEFCQYLKNILCEYELVNNRVVHTSRQASCALVEAFQIIRLNTKRNKFTMRRLEHCAQIIAQFGTREQQEMFGKALKNHEYEDVNFFLPLLASFEKHLHEFLFSEEAVA